jgi:hypothetical protein
MWARVGTPTGRSISGTVEEFEEAHRLWRQYRRPTIMFYFNTADPVDADVAQMRAVAEFKSRVAQIGALYWQYRGPDQFEAQVRQHLYRQVLALTQAGPSSGAETPPGTQTRAAPRLEDGSLGVQAKLSAAGLLAVGEGVVAVANAQTQTRPPGWSTAGVSAATLIVVTNARMIWWFIASHGQAHDPQIAWWLTYEQIEAVRVRSIPIDPFRPKLKVTHKLPLERKSILSWLLTPATTGAVIERYVRSHIGQ